MKKLFNISLAAVTIAALCTTSCKKVLNKEDLQYLSPAEAFNDSTLAIRNVNYLYTANQPSWFGSTGGALGSGGGMCDEFYSDNAFVKGTVTIETVGDIGTKVSTSTDYGKIRTINETIAGLQGSTLPKSTKNRYIAQALFWRAFRYFDLVRLYGGVPLVLTPLPAIGEAAKAADVLPRNKTSECFAQIEKDLDTCMKYLPSKWTGSDYGRITSGAAAAFLGRVLLTYASPEFNPNNDQARWQAAYTANTNAVNMLTAAGYALYPSYDGLWFVKGTANTEAVMVTEYNNQTDDNGTNPNTYDNATRPAYLGTKGGSNQPTWDMVKAYPMLDGQAPGVSTKYPYSDQTFYKNRDPRFDKTIAYNGCVWPLLNNPTYRLWTYYYYNKATSTKSTEPSSATGTGFYLRKAIDPTVSKDNTPYIGTDWIEIRFAEVLLNQAECAAEIGNLGVGQEAYANLIAIRKRAGIEPGADGLYGLAANMDHDQMINAIMYERQIELAFEGKRYWDLRRRKLLESTLNGTKRSGLTITLNNTNNTDYLSSTRDSLANVSLDALYNTVFSIKTKPMDSYNINVQPGDYFFGIPTAALQNNAALQQNNTWGGPFDPQQ